MASIEQKKRLLQATIAVALHDALGSAPKEEEIHQVFLRSRVMYKAMLGLHYLLKAGTPHGYAHRLCQGLHQRTIP
jgi:hypothetical protein